MSANPVRDDTRYDSQPLATCPICRTEFRPDGRGRFCRPRCRQTAYRLRHRQADTATLAEVTDQLRREHRLIARTVYECSSCQERLLGERRCSSCNLSIPGLFFELGMPVWLFIKGFQPEAYGAEGGNDPARSRSRCNAIAVQSV
jgi:hypothetical protein